MIRILAHSLAMFSIGVACAVLVTFVVFSPEPIPGPMKDRPAIEPPAASAPREKVEAPTVVVGRVPEAELAMELLGDEVSVFRYAGGPVEASLTIDGGFTGKSAVRMTARLQDEPLTNPCPPPKELRGLIIVTLVRGIFELRLTSGWTPYEFSRIGLASQVFRFRKEDHPELLEFFGTDCFRSGLGGTGQDKPLPLAPGEEAPLVMFLAEPLNGEADYSGVTVTLRVRALPKGE